MNLLYDYVIKIKVECSKHAKKSLWLKQNQNKQKKTPQKTRYKPGKKNKEKGIILTILENAYVFLKI